MKKLLKGQFYVHHFDILYRHCLSIIYTQKPSPLETILRGTKTNIVIASVNINNTKSIRPTDEKILKSTQIQCKQMVRISIRMRVFAFVGSFVKMAGRRRNASGEGEEDLSVLNCVNIYPFLGDICF